MESISHKLGRFAAGLTWDKIPLEVLEKAKTCLLNGVGIGLSCYALESAKSARRLIKEYEKSNDKGATLIGDGSKVSLMGAAFANATMFHSRGQEDTHGTMHIGTMVIPSALAVAEWTGSNGKDVLTAVIAGYEIAAALGKELTPFTTPRGFRASPIYGIFGSAAAAGKLLCLNEEQMVNAFGFAAAFACGTLETFSAGSMEVFFENGMACRNGIMAALIAKSGMQGAKSSIDGQVGFVQAFAGKREKLDLDRIGANLGKKWEILIVNFKPFATCAFNQGALTLMMRLIKKHDLKADQVARIDIRMTPYEANYPGIKYTGPFTTHLQTLMSTAFAASVALLNRKVYLSDMWRFEDEDISKLCEITTVNADENLAPLNALLDVELKDGRILKDELRIDPSFYFYDFDQDIDLITKIHEETKVPKKVTANLISHVRDVTQWNSVDNFLQSLTFNLAK